MSTPTPTDPREEQPYVPLSKVLSKEFKDGLVRTEPAASGGDPISIEGSFVDSHTEQAESTNSKLAAEIAELKKGAPINTHVRLFDLVRYQRSELLHAKLITEEEYTWLCAGPMAMSPKGGSPSRQRLEDYDTLRAELEAARKELDRVYREFVSKDVLDTALAAKDAAEKALNDVAAFVRGPVFAQLGDSGISKLNTLLTPAPTQEPPAGGVNYHTPGCEASHGVTAAGVEILTGKSCTCGVASISTEKKGGDEPCAQKPQSQKLTESSESKPAESSKSSEASMPSTTTCASNSPADVQPEGRGEWMPIETAPKDGTRVLIWNQTMHGTPTAEVAYYSEPLPLDMKRWWKNRNKLFLDVTHWQPLPPPPLTSQH